MDKKKKIKFCWLKTRHNCEDYYGSMWEKFGNDAFPKKWLYDFEAFYEDIQAGWFPGARLVRINRDKGYSKENCKWLTRGELAKLINTKYRTKIDGINMSITELTASPLNIHKFARPTINNRFVRGIRGHDIFKRTEIIKKDPRTSFITIDGVRKHIREWAEISNLPFSTVKSRYFSGIRSNALIAPKRRSTFSEKGY